MHTVYEAKKLECRQAFTQQPAGWMFPKCSATACGHWLVDRSQETLGLKAEREEGSTSYSPLNDTELEAFKRIIEAHTQDGWEAAYPAVLENLRHNKALTLKRNLNPEDCTGRCGLIFDPQIEVNVG